MHLFFDTVWKLHIGEIPEKCSITCHKGKIDECHNEDCALYNETIAAIKQNALTVGNPGVIASKLDSLEWVGRINKADVYKWPGGYKTKETPENRDGRLVAILKLPNGKYQNKCYKPLPEEKKNTMETKYGIEMDRPTDVVYSLYKQSTEAGQTKEEWLETLREFRDEFDIQIEKVENEISRYDKP